MSLYRFEREEETDELVAALERSESSLIRRRAAEILGDLAADPCTGDNRRDGGHDAVVTALVSAARSDDDEVVRTAAVDALDQCGQRALERLVAELSGRDLEASTDWVTARAFAEVLDADRPELRMAAATGLGRVGDSSVTAGLVDRLEDPDPRVRARSAQACGRIADPRAVKPLRGRLDDADTEVRQAAAAALGEIHTGDAASALLEFTADESESVRREAVDALGRFGSLEPVDMLVAALEDDAETVRRTAMFSLVEILSNAPPQRSHEVRQATAEELAAATADEVVPPLTEILTESDGAPQRRNAAWLLGRVAGSEYRGRAREALVETLDDDDTTTAQFAASSLVELGERDVESRLLECIDDDETSKDARSKALFALGNVGGDDARERLGAFVDDTDDDDLRERAFSALSKLGGIGTGDVR